MGLLKDLLSLVPVLGRFVETRISKKPPAPAPILTPKDMGWVEPPKDDPPPAA